MTKNPKDIPSRNAPCACGSGKKSKHCCGRVPAAAETPVLEPARSTSATSWFAAFGLLGFVAVAVYVMISVDRDPSETLGGTSAAAPLSSGPSSGDGSTPEAWEYDDATNQHWDPTHGHWHNGPPPASAGESNAPAQTPGSSDAETGATPEAWEYDENTNQHWDPGHGHWHGGPPPPEASRE